MKSAGLAVVLSFLLPGLGQIYNGQVAKGLITLGIFAAAIPTSAYFFAVGLVLCPILWVWAMIDAYRVAERHNRLLAERGPQCRACGSALRGLPAGTTNCPNCGMAIDLVDREALTAAAAGS